MVAAWPKMLPYGGRGGRWLDFWSNTAILWTIRCQAPVDSNWGSCDSKKAEREREREKEKVTEKKENNRVD